MHNIIDILKHDHNELKEIMNQLANLQNGGDKQLYDEYFTKFKEEFKTHDAIEEKILYPELKDHPQVSDLIHKGFEAHHMVKIGIIELRLVPFQSDNWPAKFAVIQDNIVSHMEEEETILFPQIQQILGPTVLEELGQKALDFSDKPLAVGIGV